MKRSPMPARRAPLKAGKPMARGSGPPPINPERRARLRLAQYGPPERREWISEFPCDTCGAPPPSQQSHEPPRSTTGLADDILPQCPACHGKMGNPGPRAFERELGKPPLWFRQRTAFYAALWGERSGP